MDEDELGKIVERLRREEKSSAAAVSLTDDRVRQDTHTPTDSVEEDLSKMKLRTGVGYFVALAPLVPYLKPKPKQKPSKKDDTAAAIVIPDDDEIEQKPVTEKKRPMTDAERAQKSRAAKKQRSGETKLLGQQMQDLLNSLRRSRNKANQYEEENLAFMLRCGTCPSAAGARSPLASIFSTRSTFLVPGIVFRLNLSDILA